MIKSTFQILPRVAAKRERALWGQGIRSWEDFINAKDIKGVSKGKKRYLDRQLLRAKHELYAFNSSYFFRRVPGRETWRLYDFFKEEACFFDIESEGTGKYADITVVGIYDGIDTKSMIKGVNLDYRLLRKELSNYKLLITFNGSRFDIPFIEKRYDILPNAPRIDVLDLCARLGIRGGLKNIEKDFGIRRSEIIERIYGGDPLKLWRMYNGSGDKYYLDLLVEYNEEDVINLKKIMNYCYNKLTEKIQDEIAGQ